MATKPTTGRPWMQSGNSFRQISANSELITVLPKAVYAAKFNDFTKEFFLEKLDEKFTFNSKLYGLEDKFISHVLYTFEHTTQNLGILLNGEKGTGKTVCAKIIANEMNLPVILCDIALPELTSFIANFNVPAVFFFDEFEKNFQNHTEILLSAMDGAYNTDTRKIFILTTNSLYINDNFIGRPSRIRYKKMFGNLPQNVIKEYCDENLEDKSKYEEIAAFIDTLSISTIDILKSIVEEVNMHKCSVEDFKHFFNVTTAPYKYNTLQVEATNMYSIDEFKREANTYLKLHGFQSAYDVDEDEDESKKNDVNHKLISATPNRGHFEAIKVSSGKSVYSLSEGDAFHHGTVVKTMDADNILVLSNSYSYGKPYIFVKVLDVESKPSLYSPLTCIF